MADWDLSPGSNSDRKSLSARFGGAFQGGIAESAQTPNVLLFSDPEEGAKYGYSFDGWVSDDLFLYTGDGQEGDQRPLVGGNKAVFLHQQQGRSLRLFMADGLVRKGSKTKRQLYLGQFEVHDEDPSFPAEALDRNKEMRAVIVFRLRPVGDVLHRDKDRSELGEPPKKAAAQIVDAEASAELIPPEQHATKTYKTKGAPPTTAQRVESDLLQRYRKHLKAQGHQVDRYKIRPPGAAFYLYNDLFDVDTSELCEAKGVTTRESIRNLVGQLLDYHRHAPTAKTLAALVPVRPSDDLLDLLHRQGIACVYEAAPNSFVRVDP